MNKRRTPKGDKRKGSGNRNLYIQDIHFLLFHLRIYFDYRNHRIYPEFPPQIRLEYPKLAARSGMDPTPTSCRHGCGHKVKSPSNLGYEEDIVCDSNLRCNLLYVNVNSGNR